MFVSSSCILVPVPVCCLCLPCISHLWRLHYLLCSGGAELLALSARGQLQRIILPAGRKDAGLSNLPSMQVGRGVRDLLSAIGDVCERYGRSLFDSHSETEHSWELLRFTSVVLNLFGALDPLLVFSQPWGTLLPPTTTQVWDGGHKSPKAIWQNNLYDWINAYLLLVLKANMLFQTCTPSSCVMFHNKSPIKILMETVDWNKGLIEKNHRMFRVCSYDKQDWIKTIKMWLLIKVWPIPH